MSDIVAQLEVFARENGCLLDISKIVNSALCPKIDIISDKPHTVEEKEDYVCVTPTGPKPKPTPIPLPSPLPPRECSKKTCFEVQPEVCERPTVALDLQYLVILGLISQEDLEKYLWTTGALKEGEKLYVEDEDVEVDPWLSEDWEEDWEQDWDNGLHDRGYPSSGYPSSKGSDQLLDADVIGEKDQHKPGFIDADVITHSRNYRRNCDSGKCKPWPTRPWGHSGWESTPGKPTPGKPVPVIPVHDDDEGSDQLLDLDLISSKDKGKPAFIDLDVITSALGRRGYYPGYHPESKGSDQLLDADVIGEKDQHKPAFIDADVITHSVGRRQVNQLQDLDILSTLTKDTGGILPGKPEAGKPGHYSGGFLTHYQPICKKGFRTGHRDNAERCASQDVNHCLALCHAEAARLTLEAGVKPGEAKKVLHCAAVEFNKSIDGDNCRYFVAPESEPCRDEELVENDDCVSFVRN